MIRTPVENTKWSRGKVYISFETIVGESECRGQYQVPERISMDSLYKLGLDPMSYHSNFTAAQGKTNSTFNFIHFVHSFLGLDNLIQLQLHPSISIPCHRISIQTRKKAEIGWK